MDAHNKVVKLLVGEDKPTTLSVHQNVLCKTSQFFKRAIKPEWADLRDDRDTIDLSDDMPEIVLLYVDWLYSRELVVDMAQGGLDDQTFARYDQTFVKLAGAYVFGEKVMDSEFKNAVVIKFIEAKATFRFIPGSEAAAVIYNGTSPGSRMRLLLSEFIAYHAGSHPSWIKHLENYPHETLIDAIKIMARVRDSPREETHPFQVLNDKYLEKDSS